MDVSKIIHPVGIARFRAIATGGLREIPAEYFVSEKMRRLMDSLRERYRERFIVLDGPRCRTSPMPGSSPNWPTTCSSLRATDAHERADRERPERNQQQETAWHCLQRRTAHSLIR